MNAKTDITAYRQRLNQVMRPVADPIIVDDVYTQREYDTLLDIVRHRGPWPTILAHHFKTMEEVIATTSGQIQEGVTLDDITRPNFRGYFASSSVCYYPELYETFYSRKLIELVKNYWQAEYVRPDRYLFNMSGPMGEGLNPHVDATTFRGITHENTPVWLQNVMVKSGLFGDYIVKMGQVIVWWYRGAIGGSFTYWPDGPLGMPKMLKAPFWNRGVVVQNELMFHRGDASGPIEQRNPPGVKFRSVLASDPSDRDRWLLKTDDDIIARYHTDDMRFLVHWSAEVFIDMAECKKVMDHTDDLTHERVFDTLIRDMRAQGVEFAIPTDPLNDAQFIRALIKTYDIMPEILEVPAA